MIKRIIISLILALFLTLLIFVVEYYNLEDEVQINETLQKTNESLLIENNTITETIPEVNNTILDSENIEDLKEDNLEESFSDIEYIDFDLI